MEGAATVISGQTEPVTRGRRNPLHFGLPQRLRAARDDADLGTAQLSLKAGLSDPVAAGIEQGRVPGLDTVEKLARVLKCSPCWLAYGIEAPPLSVDILASAAIGTRLQQIREIRAVSRKGLGKLAELSTTAISNIEAGRTVPSVATVEKIAKALQADPCWLAYGAGQAPDLLPVR